jgi:hypothetical protein
MSQMLSIFAGVGYQKGIYPGVVEKLDTISMIPSF